MPSSFVTAHNSAMNGLKTALFEPEVKFDMSFVFRKGKDQIPRIESFLYAFERYLSQKDYVSRLTEISEKY